MLCARDHGHLNWSSKLKQSVLTGRDIICLSTQDWSGLWTRKHRFMKMFAEAGNRVMYIETPVHLLGLDVLPHEPSRFFRFLKGPRRIQERLHIATLPILLPMFQMSHTINSLNQILIAAMLQRWIRELGFVKPLLWIYTPFSAALISKIDHSGVVYDCVDEFRAAQGLVRSTVIGSMEDDLLRKATATIVTHENLLPHRSKLCPATFHVPNAADVRAFRQAALSVLETPKDIESIPAPRFGFVGHIQYWVDLKLIRFLAEQKPGWSFVLLGPISPLARVRELKHLNNVHLLGRKKQSEIPAYVQSMTCCLNPYITGSLADHCSPLKLYEYLAAGKPVVSTEMPEARKFPGSVRVGASYTEFLSACEAVLRSLPESKGIIEKRLETASEHSWQNRFQALNGVLAGVLDSN
jgi:glycosyltransferase involved in cell wall biosynthesis